MVVNNFMHVLIDKRASKTKMIGFPDLRFLQFGVGEFRALNSKLLMGINRT